MKKRTIFAVITFITFLAACSTPEKYSLTGSDVWHDHATRPFMDLRRYD